MTDKIKSLVGSPLSITPYDISIPGEIARDLLNKQRKREGLPKISVEKYLAYLKGADTKLSDNISGVIYRSITLDDNSDVKSAVLDLWNKLIRNEVILTNKAGIVDVIVGDYIPTVDDLIIKQTVMGCFYQDNLIGFISGKHDESPKGKSFEVSMLYVEEDYRHTGVGKNLWNNLMEKISPVDTVVTNVMYNNPEAIAFYKSLGMKEFIVMMSV